MSGVTDCTAAINAALNDSANIGVPIQALGKTYLTQGGHQLPSDIVIQGTGFNPAGTAGTVVKLAGGATAANVMQSLSWGLTSGTDLGITLKDLCIHGNMFAQSGHGAAWMPEAQVTANASLSSSPSTVTVTSTTGFASTGAAWVGFLLVQYTGTTGTTFTGCTTVSGASGTIRAGASVIPHGSVGHCLALQAGVSRCDNLLLIAAAGSNLMIQGTPVNIAYENHFGALKAGTSNRYAVELQEQATDNNFTHPVLGDHNAKGCILNRAADNSFVNPHLVGSHSPQDAAIILTANIRVTQPVFDSIPYDAIKLDSAMRGDVAIADPVITDATTGYCPFAGTKTASFIRPRRVSGGSQLLSRGRFTGQVGTPFGTAAYKSGYRAVSDAVLIGAQNPTSSPTIQVDNVSGFWDQGSGAQTISIGTDTISYTGRSIAIGTCPSAVSSGLTSFSLDLQTVPGSAAFAAGAGIVLVAGGPSNSTWQEVPYTSYNLTTQTFSGCTIASNISAGAQVTQCFLTGVSGAVSGTTYTDQTGMTGGSVGMLSNTSFGLNFGTTFSSAIAPNGLDIYTFGRDWSRQNKPVFFAGILTIAAAGTTASVNHGLFITPTLLQATPQADLGAGIRYFVTASSSQVTVTLAGGTAPGGGVTFGVTAEVPPTS